MVCDHLKHVERALREAAIPVTFRGAAWSDNCREWVYFDAFLDTARIREHFALAAVVEDHTHRGTHDGQEHGLVCSECKDALMGVVHPMAGKPVFP